MGAQLDLDDVAATSELAKQELSTLRADNQRMREALEDRIGFSYQRDVPHQSQIPYCRCRKCVDERVRAALGKEKWNELP